jgi:nucleoside-diphosphate-sugar epimerase
VRALKGDTAADLVLSVVPGAVERSVVVRGQRAVARCDVERDLYCLDAPTGQPLQLDNFLTAASLAWQLGANATRNVLKVSNPFLDSVARSVGRFYDSLGGAADRRLDAAFGAEVVAACERIAASAPNEPARVTHATVARPKRSPTVLVLGGAGFIGRHLVSALAGRGFGIRVATRSLGSARIALAGLAVELAEGDLADAAFVDAALDNIEVVYDLTKAEVPVTRHIAERAMARGVKRFIYTGTIDSYYSAKAAHAITADTPLDPKIEGRNAYARSKAACEDLLMALHREHAFPAVIFRPGIVIGKGCAPAHWGVGRFWSEGRMQFWGDGLHPLPLVLVEDVAEALVLALDKPGIEGQVFLLTGEPLLSARDYVQAVSAASGAPLHAEPTPIWKFYLHDLLKETVKHLIRHPNRRRPTYRDWDSRSHRARYDNSKAKQVLGWRPAATREALIERGVAEAVRDSVR